MANGILYVARGNLIQALDPAHGTVLWSNTRIGRIHWDSPIVANGVLYIADDGGGLTAFGL